MLGIFNNNLMHDLYYRFYIFKRMFVYTGISVTAKIIEKSQWAQTFADPV